MVGAAGCTLMVGTAGRGLVWAGWCTLTVGPAGRSLVGAGGFLDFTLAARALPLRLGLRPWGLRYALAVWALPSPQLNEFIYVVQMNS
jgi:hypothetical protein